MEREITSRDNPLVKQYVKLASSRSARREEGLFVTEGMKLTAEAFASEHPAVLMFATEVAMEKYAEQAQTLAMQSEQFVRVSAGVAEKLSQTQTPQGIFGVFRVLDNVCQDVTIKKEGRYLLLSGLQDPGNYGTILRTAAALGVDGIFSSPDCPEPLSPKVLRASMGGVFKLPLFAPDQTEVQIALLRAQGVKVYAAAPQQDAVALSPGLLGAGCAVVIGSEGAGLSQAIIEACDGVVTLPMRPDSESLNAAMAAGIFLWEMTR